MIGVTGATGATGCTGSIYGPYGTGGGGFSGEVYMKRTDQVVAKKNCTYCGRQPLPLDRNCFGCGAPV